MKVAIVGKGGSGKTTTSATIARALAKRGAQVVALDCDVNANLGLSLGIGVEAVEELSSMRLRLEEGEQEHAGTMQDLLDTFGSPGPDGLQFAVVNKIETPNAGCPCCGLSPDSLLGELDAPDRIVIADMEAGIGTLARLEPGAVDVVVVVVEPTHKSLDVARRALGLAEEKGIGRHFVVANRITSDADLAFVRQELGDLDLVVVPEDRAVVEADRAGVSPWDHDPDSAAVRSLLTLADRLGAAPAVA